MVLTTSNDTDTHGLVGIALRGIHLEAADFGCTFLIGVTHHDGDRAYNGVSLLHGSGGAAAAIHETTGINGTGGVLSLYENLTIGAVGDAHGIVHGHTHSRHRGSHPHAGIHAYSSLTGNSRLVNVGGSAVTRVGHRKHRAGGNRLLQRSKSSGHSVGSCGAHGVTHVAGSRGLAVVLGNLGIKSGIHIAAHGHGGLAGKREILARHLSLGLGHHGRAGRHHRIIRGAAGGHHQGGTGYETVLNLHADTENITNDRKKQG